MRKNGESDESFKNRFTTEQPCRYDVLQSKEVTFLSADGCSKRASEFSKPGYHLKPSDGRRLNFFIKEHRSMFDKLNGMVKHLKENKKSFHTIYKVIHKEHTDKQEAKKERKLKKIK